jgi:CTD small phosphatase-like protein 2
LPPLTKAQRNRPIALPRKTRSSPKMTLVLDLDETLVHCSTFPFEDADLMFQVEFNEENYEVSMRHHGEIYYILYLYIEME